MELTSKELDRIALKVCAECGIKDSGIPSVEVIDLCLKSWEDKFSTQMNVHELLLAFEMNVNGDLETMIDGKPSLKVEHYQCFSREYFTSVLNRYLQKKQEAVIKAPKKESETTQEPANYQEGLMRALIQDRENASLGKPITTAHTVMARFEMMCELFDVKYGDETIQSYRQVAAQNVIASLFKKKNEAILLQKYGREVELTNQIARIKAQKMITDADEQLVQAEVLVMLYGNQLLKWTEFEFVNHVESQIPNP